MNSRFGVIKNEEIDCRIKKSVPINTVRSKNSVWCQFEAFCKERDYDIMKESVSPEILSMVLKDWGQNMRKKDGGEYKEAVVKIMWNSVAKQIQEIYFEKFQLKIDPFSDILFKTARDSRDCKRKSLQLNPHYRTSSSAAFTEEECGKILRLYDENTPDGLQKLFYHIVAHEMAWRGGEGSACLTTYFKEEFDNKGQPTGRIEYNPIISKTAQGGNAKLTDSKWIVTNKENTLLCPVRLYKKLLQQRGKNISTERFFLTTNKNWKPDTNLSWFINCPIGKNTMSKWTKTAAEQIGIDTKKIKITNHSHRSTTVSHLAKSGIQDQVLIKMTGHSSTSSVKPYLKLDTEHHKKIVKNLRCVASSSTITPQDDEVKRCEKVSDSNVYNNCTFHFYNK